MTAGEGAGWRFLPAGAAADDLAAAHAQGSAAFARALRIGRAEVGAGRTMAAMRGLALRATRPLRLLVAAPIQARSFADALSLSFAIAGFELFLASVEGFAALRSRLGEPEAVDFVLLVDPSSSAQPDPVLVSLGREVAARWAKPVALARFGEALAETPIAAGVDLLTIGIAPPAALDTRFAASFGTLLKPAAADRLGDAVAAWAARQQGHAPKLVVTDLDGTLWQGTLGEPADPNAPGQTVPPPHRAYAEALRTLSERGIVLAVASRNEPADAEAALGSASLHPLSRQDFAAVAAGWDDKAALVARVLAVTGLGADHAVFVDDDPVNCAKVAARFPAMDVRLLTDDPDTFAASLLADPLLLGGGAEAGLRAERYRAKAGVDRLRSETPDVDSFLAALGTRLTLAPLEGPDQPRAAELASRVNQFVFRAFRPSVLDLARRTSSFDTLVRLDDAFGSHGIVGLILATAKGETLVLDNLFLSCRALERGVEDAMLEALALRARRAGMTRLVGRIDEMPRNGPARSFLARVARLAADGSFDYGPPEGRAPSKGAPRIFWQDGTGDAP